MLQLTGYAVQSAVGSVVSVVLVVLQIIQWMMQLAVVCFGCWAIYSGVRAIWCGSLVVRLHTEWAITLLSTSLKATSGYCAMTILVLCKLLVGCRALQLILQQDIIQTAHCQNTKHSKRSHTTTSPQSRKAAKKTSGKENKDQSAEGKLELCSQCFIRCAGALEVVYVEFPDKDKLADLHGGRQNSTNKMRNCPKYISELSGDEKVTWKTALQRMRRDGTLTNMYGKFAKEHYGP